MNYDKLFALYPEGNGKPLKCFMLKSDRNRFTFQEDESDCGMKNRFAGGENWKWETEEVLH